MNHREATQNVFEVEAKLNDLKDVSVFISQINNRICGLGLNHGETNQVFEICIELINKTQQLNEIFMNKKNGLDPIQAAQMSTSIIQQELQECATRYKRDKKISKNKFYVAPEEKVIGLCWVPCKLPETSIAVPRLIPNVFQKIPLIKSIISLFEREDFRKEYFFFNEQRAKLVSTDVYTSFSSGHNFKTNELFASHPNSLQIEIGQDDFEPCNALGSRATLYKLSPEYTYL